MTSARPRLIRSKLAKSSYTRTGSATPSRVVALVSRIREVLAATAARTTAGEEVKNSALWCSPSAKTSRPSWSASTA